GVGAGERLDAAVGGLGLHAVEKVDVGGGGAKQVHAVDREGDDLLLEVVGADVDGEAADRRGGAELARGHHDRRARAGGAGEHLGEVHVFPRLRGAIVRRRYEGVDGGHDLPGDGALVG